ncbi:hypothetical protein EV284_3605 [Streptomyces sp. BK022]|nr:hypothetical protein [Streptomyces sp. BK022]RZU36117.1 hypothetical protein EV284_3605 [Streptomyces sp. BK022]
MGAPSLTPQELRGLAEMEQGLNDRACRRWEAAERAGLSTPWPMDPTQV